MASDDIQKFLAARLEGGSQWVGISSNAMVREALGGKRVRVYSEYPHDHADLSRCCMTYARAPWSLKQLMLPRLTVYCQYAMNGFRPRSETKVKRGIQIDRNWRQARRVRAPYRFFGRQGRIVYVGPLLIVL